MSYQSRQRFADKDVVFATPASLRPTVRQRLAMLLKIWRARALTAGIDAEPGTVFGHTRVAAGEGTLELVEVQPEGRRTIDANAWLAGRRAPDPLLGT